MNCQQCEAVAVNGVKIHEEGCPDEWLDHDLECKWCGAGFTPEFKNQPYCSPCCYHSYTMTECDCEFCEEIEMEMSLT